MSSSPAVRSAKERIFQSVDWCAFCVTVPATFAGYYVTLAPQVTLGFGGIFSTGAMYAGVPHPPGYPVWTVYAWLFTLLPVSNIAWGVALSSAVAASLACGLIALMVSRGSVEICDAMPSFQSLTDRQKAALRVLAGCVAGMGFGFDGKVWQNAVIADSWALSLCLLCSVLCVMMRWFYRPAHTRYLYAAFFVYGLTFCNSQALLTAALGLQLLVMLTDRELGREIFFANIAFLLLGFVLVRVNNSPSLQSYLIRLKIFYFIIGFTSTAICATLIVRTRGLLSGWRTAVASGAMFLLGTASYFYIPLASMTNPPVNWGYARTVTGFFHVLTRGQYERVQVTEGLGKLLRQLIVYGQITASQLGVCYLLLALIPFCAWGRLPRRQRRWILGLLALYLCLVVLLMMLLNPGIDRQSLELWSFFFSASHIILALWAGYGVVVLIPLLTRSHLEPIKGA